MTCYFCRLALSLCLVFASSTFAQPEEVETRTPVVVQTKRASIYSRSLPRLVELAEQYSPNIQKPKNLLEISELEKQNSFSKFLPSLDIEARHGYLDTSPQARPNPIFSDMVLNLHQHLYDPDNNATLSRYWLHGARLDRIRHEYEQQRDEQLMRVAHTYLDWSDLLQQREIDENKRDLLRRQFNILEAQYKQGLRTKRDMLRIETEMKRLEMHILRRDNEVDIAFQKLASHVGMSAKDLEAQDIEGEEAKPFGIVGSDPAELKVEDHRRAKIFSLREQEAGYETAIVDRNYWPKLSVDGELKYHNHDYIDSPTSWEDTKDWTWGVFLVLRYNLWDWGIRRRDTQIVRIRERHVRDENRQMGLELTNELRDVYLRLREHRAHVKTTRELLVLEQQSYSILEAEYRNGRASYLDLIYNLNSLIDSRSMFMSSYFGLKRQQVLYSFHKGDLYETLKQK